MMHFVWCSVLLVISAQGAQEISASEVISLKEALELVLKNSPDLTAETHRVEIAELQEANVRSRFFPSLDIEGTHGVLKSSPTSATDPWTSSLSLGLTENLYDNGENFVRLKAASANRELAALQRKNAREKHLLAAATGFFQYSLQNKIRALKAEQQRLVKEQFKIVQDYFHQGLKPEKEALRIQAEVERADLDLQDAEISLRRSEAELLRTLGLHPLDPAPDFQITEEKDIPVDVPSSVPNLTETFPYRIAQLTSENAKYDVALSSKAGLPRLDVTAALTYSNEGYLGSSSAFTANQSTQANLLLTLRYNILDWGLRARNIAIASKTQGIRERELQSVQLKLESELKALMLQLGRLKSRLEMTKRLLNLEEKNYRSLTGDYKEGKINAFNLVDGLTNLLKAKTEYFSARYQLATEIAEYYYYEGTLYEKLAKT